MLKNISRAFKHENYRNYFFWQFLSFVGTWIQSTAQSWLVYRMTHSALFLGAVSFAGSLPSLIFAPLSGIVADRFNRKKVLITTQIFCVIQAIILIILYFLHILNEWHVLFFAIFLGIANSFDVTARQTFIPLLVTKDELLNAIALNSSMFNAARIIGPAVAGVLIAAYNEGICFILNVLSYIPIIIFLIFLKTKEHIKKEISSVQHLKEGISFAWKNRPIKLLLLLLGTFSFFGMSFTTLLPIFSDQILNTGPKGLGVLMGASGTGAVLGGLFLASRQKILGVKKIIGFCSLISGSCILIFAHSKNFMLSILLLLVIGFCFIIINAGSNTLMQAMSPDYLRGRIIGFYSMMFMGMFPLGSLTTGFLAQKFNVHVAVSIGAIACLIAGFYFLLAVPELVKQAKVLLQLNQEAEVVVEEVS